MPPVSTTLAKLVAKFSSGVVDTFGKFATGVVDTGGNFATGVVDTGGALNLRISPRIFKKFETVLMGYSGAGGKITHEKTRSKKSRDTVPLNINKETFRQHPVFRFAKYKNAPNPPTSSAGGLC